MRGLLSTVFGLACGPNCPTLTPSQLTDVQRPLLVAGTAVFGRADYAAAIAALRPPG